MSTDEALIQTLSHLVQASYPATEPGVAVIVVKEGEVIYRAGQGMANLELGVPIAPDMVFRLGSLTKQFTAVAILMLAEQGALALDDPLTKFLPDYPTHAHTITVRHLLTHTSGIKSYTEIPEWPPLWRKDFSVQALVDFFKFQPMQFAPGQRWAYNNSGYILLGAIIEKLSGQTYAQFIQQRIFNPLGMTHSYYDTPERLIPGRAAGYDRGPEGYTNAPYLSMTQPYAAGSLASNVDDLALWDAALDSDRLLKPATLRQAFVSYRLPDGSATDYGFGWLLHPVAGRPAISHGGGIHGFGSMGIRLPADHVYVAALSNNTGNHPTQLALKLAGWVVGQPYSEPAPVELSAEALSAVAGDYHSETIGDWRFMVADHQLWAQPGSGQRMALVPFAPAQFFVQGRSLEQFIFVQDSSGAIVAFELHAPFTQGFTGARVSPAGAAPAP